VGAAVEDSEARVTFALTNTAQPVAPALQPERARILVKQRLLLNYPEDEKLLLHGPVLLGTGTQIATANPTAPETAATSYIASKLSWFFWLDAAPSSLYGHPTRFILIDASNLLPDLPREARVSQELWWPLITPAGSDKAAALLPPPGVPVVQPVL